MNKKHNLHNKYNEEIRDYVTTLENTKHTLTKKQIKLTIQTIWNLINEAKSCDVCIEDSISKRFLQLEYECSCLV